MFTYEQWKEDQKEFAPDIVQYGIDIEDLEDDDEMRLDKIAETLEDAGYKVKGIAFNERWKAKDYK